MESGHPSIRYLFSLLGSIRGENFGLRRMERLMAELGHPERDAGIIHIAGTNGKGSTAAMIESGLRAAGRTTGLYTSPHLRRINERFLLNGAPASDAALAAAIEPVRRANERLAAAQGPGAHPTFFESVTAAALMLFRQAGVAYRIIETGLGGRLDASNVVWPQLAALTRIDHDHERFLGRGLARIASEKGAIIKAGCRAVIGRQAPEARQVLLACARRAEARVVDVETEWKAWKPCSAAGRWRFKALAGKRSIPAQLALAGRHQIENALTAIAALDGLGVAGDCISAGLRRTRWPGRLEFLPRQPPVLLDAAHNPPGARALAAFLRQEAPAPGVTLIYGSSRDKAVEEIAGWLFPAVDRVILTRSKVERAASPRALLRAVGHHHARIETAADIESALQAAGADAKRTGWIAVAGSLFLVGEARELLG